MKNPLNLSEEINVGKPDILIVEDDPSTYYALPILLRSYGFSSKLVNNVKDALLALKDEPKFLLLDLVLTDGDGVEVLKQLKLSGLKTKCAITTGYLTEDLSLLGCPVLMKPIDLDKLLQFLEGKDNVKPGI